MSAVPSAVTARIEANSADKKSQSPPTNEKCKQSSTSKSSQSKSQPSNQATGRELAERKQKASTTASTGIFDGTVDRIVDDEHVVLLVESDEGTLEQFVEPREELPNVDEGAAVRALLFRGVLIRVWRH